MQVEDVVLFLSMKPKFAESILSLDPPVVCGDVGG